MKCLLLVIQNERLLLMNNKQKRKRFTLDEMKAVYILASFSEQYRLREKLPAAAEEPKKKGLKYG